VHEKIIAAVKRVEFVNGRMSYIKLRGRWCHIIVLNVHAPPKDFLHSSSTGEKIRAQCDSTSAIHRLQESL
jgi:hypothetical protein